jgi:hypothetical protein
MGLIRSVILAPESQRARHAKKHSAPPCPKCRKPMHFIIVKTGGRKFRCVECNGVDPMRLPDIQAWIKGELQPPKLH